jgi:hypothetical protein
MGFTEKEVRKEANTYKRLSQWRKQDRDGLLMHRHQKVEDVLRQAKAVPVGKECRSPSYRRCVR